ncbi:translocation/assembly module TamB domain-containing protein [Propionivibrio limicola]|uniref:translocation/assembly module TamB domain-containing protein n=1 Tax=Propionivibrio limicola TaxID=167645 RepID=UPI0012918CC4|nr:translocation/assembly module TamB domain-containing protein [Propionivibrio limicola]
MKLKPKRMLLALMLVLSATLAVAGWLVVTESGLQVLARLAMTATRDRLFMADVQGRLLGDFSIGTLRWTAPELQIEAGGIEVAWAPATLVEKRIQIDAVRIARLRIDSAESAEPAPLPADLTLPLPVAVRKFAVAAFEWGDSLSVTDMAGRLESDGEQHRLAGFSARVLDTAITSEVSLSGKAPFRLHGTGRVRGLIADKPLELTLGAEGTLERIELVATGQKGVSGEGQIRLTPFAAVPYAQARLAVKDVDPAAWLAGSPHALLSMSLEVEPQGEGVTGRFSAINHRPGLLDQHLLPFEKGHGKFNWQSAGVLLSELSLVFPDGGSLSGEGKWAENLLTLSLGARRVDAARLISTLRQTRLNGPVSIVLGADRQRVALNLKDERFAVAVDAERAGSTITARRLELSSAEARLLASGVLETDERMAFSMKGELRRFDPSRFFRLPAAQLNARFDAQGRLAPGLVVDGRFELDESRYAGLPLAGRGRLNVAWPIVSHADVALSAGPSRLTVAGSFGHAQGKLTVQIDAPDLSLFGVDGGVFGQVAVSGNSREPHVALRLNAEHLGYRQWGRVSGLAVRASLAGANDSPLEVDLAAAQLDLPGHPALAKNMVFRLAGRNDNHRMELAADLAGMYRFGLGAEGGLSPGQRWHGQMYDLRLAGEDKSRRLLLRRPALVNVSRDGWSFGPAEIAGDAADWNAVVRAGADTRRLAVGLVGHGARLGQVEGGLEAAMEGSWKIAANAPWHGRLRINTADLAWLGELLGEGWQTGGCFVGELDLMGTPSRPLSSGRFNGDQLVLRLPDQGLHLDQGQLSAELDNNLLRIRRLRFASILSSVPRPLRLAIGEAASVFAEPGSLDVSGEMRIDRASGADSAFLDIQLDRLGAWQLPDQWVAVSGSGRVTWQEGALGVHGKVGVDAGYWQLAPGGMPRLSDDVVIKRPGVQSRPAFRPNLDLDVTADLGRQFLFSGAGLQTRLVGDVRLTARGRDVPRASGSIRTRDGRFDAYGQQLAIERGILTFQGLLDNPALDVRAVRKGMAVEPGVQIAGTAQRPVVRLVSDPDVPDAEKLAWLVLGHGPESMGTGDATVLLSAAGGLLGNNSANVVQQLKKTFGIDELGFRQGDISGNGGRQPSSRIAGSSVDTSATTGSQIFSVGKRLSSNAILSYEQSLGKAESVVKLTVNLTRQISVIGRTGSDNALDIFYTFTVGESPRRKRRGETTVSEPSSRSD